MHATSNRSRRKIANAQKGVAILVCVFALLLLTAAAIALMYSTNTETGVNNNYRQESIAYFAARAGVEEARDRMASSGAAGEIPAANLPTAPPDAGGSVLYVLNQGGDPSAPTPTVAGSAYFDDELCHDYFAFGAGTAPGVRCGTYPAVGGGVTTLNSNAGWNPWVGTKAAMPYKWARIAMKENSSIQYGDPVGAGAQTYYSVDPGQAATRPVCFDGINERVLPAAYATCAAWAPTVYANPVYTVTALAVAPSGARKMVQQEVGLAPIPPFIYGLFGTSKNCNAVQFNGNQESTDSYTTANGGTYASTHTNSGGDVGSNGGVNVDNGDIGGLVGVLLPPPNGPGTCANPFTIGPNGADCYQANCNSQSPTYLPNPYVFTTPPAPNPPTPNKPQTLTACGGKKGGGSNYCLGPGGSLGNINLAGNATLTLSPGVYNINSLSMSGNATINVSPAGQVVINIGGTGCDVGCGGMAAGTVVSTTGNGIDNLGTIPSNFAIDYAGSDTINLGGNGVTTAVLNAPNANITLNGGGSGGQWYGSILASTITVTGNEQFHFDRNSAQSPQNDQNYTTLAFREIAY